MARICASRSLAVAGTGGAVMDYLGSIGRVFTRLHSQVLGFGQSLFFALILALASLLGAFTPLDGRIYDGFLRSAPTLQSTDPQVLLVDSPVSAFFDAQFPWERVVADLLALGARQVVFTVFPEGSAAKALALYDHPAVILGTDLMPDPQRVDSVRFNLPATLGETTPHAIANTDESLLGVHRYQRYSYTVKDQTFPSVEALSARRLGINVEDEGRFLVNFSQPGQSFPRVKLHQVVQGNLVRDVVAGRVVMVGIGQERFHRSVVTPITSDQREITRLDYHGYALNSILTGTGIASLAPATSVLLLLATWLVFFLVAQPMGPRGAMLAGLAMFGALVALAWLALVATNVHIPVVGSALVIGTTLVSLVQRKAKHHDDALARLANTAGVTPASGLGAYRTPVSEEFWPYAMGMLDQAVPITRAIFLQRLPGASGLRPVHALRCANNALAQSDLDMSRPPFSAVAATTEALKVQGLLVPIPGERSQYLIRLALQGELLGYLVFGTSVADENLPALQRSVLALCRRLTEMIGANRQRSTDDAPAPSFARKYLSDDRDEVVAKLDMHLQLANRQAEYLAAVLDWMRIPTTVYDLFGRQLFTNTSMKSVLKEAHLNQDGVFSAADLIEQTCGLTSEQARLALTDLTVEGKAFDRAAWAGAQKYRLQGNMLGGSNLLETSYQDMLDQAHGAVFQLVPAATEVETRLPLPHKPTQQAVATAAADLWQPLEAAIAEVGAQSEFESLTITVEGERASIPVAAQSWLLRDFLHSLLQLLAYDCKLPGRVEIDVTREDSRVLVAMRNQGFGMPDTRLQSMLEGPVWPQSATLRRIRQLRGTALVAGGSLELTSSVGAGYRALVVLKTVA